MAAKKAASAEQLQSVMLIGTLLTIDYYTKNKVKGFVRKVMRKLWVLDAAASIFGLDSSSLHSHIVAVGRAQLAECAFDVEKWHDKYGAGVSPEALKMLTNINR